MQRTSYLPGYGDQTQTTDGALFGQVLYREQAYGGTYRAGIPMHHCQYAGTNEGKDP
ncbi:hypothetical protein D3C83_301300 [compost metagenome]